MLSLLVAKAYCHFDNRYKVAFIENVSVKKSLHIAKKMVNIFLKIRDKVWFYEVHRFSVFENVDEKRIRPNFKSSFSVFFAIPFVCVSCAILRIVLIESHILIILLVFPLFFLYKNMYSRIFIYLDKYPLNAKNNKGAINNITYLLFMIIVESVVFIGALYFVVDFTVK